MPDPTADQSNTAARKSASPLRPRLGLPAWAFAGWKYRYFTSVPTPLAGYARVFNAVEGNTTFYQIPSARAVQGWREAVAGSDFRFCFKLPRTVTHERSPSFDDLRAFLVAIDALGDHLGPLLVQFPARVGPDALAALDSLFSRLPRQLRCVIEVRHRSFFTTPSLLEPLLARHRLGRVVLDTRALYAGDPTHPEVRRALHQKPDLPVLPEVHHGLGFVRLVLHPAPASNHRYLDEWAARTAVWLASGHDTYVMIHCPNNLHCPGFAAQFHSALRSRPEAGSLPSLPAWATAQQHSLF